MKPFDPRLVRRSRSARWFLIAGGALAVAQAAAIIAFAWALAALVAGLIDGMRMPQAWPLLVLLVVAAGAAGRAGGGWGRGGAGRARRVEAARRAVGGAARGRRAGGVRGVPAGPRAPRRGPGRAAVGE